MSKVTVAFLIFSTLASHFPWVSSLTENGRNIHVLVKTMCPPGYHHKPSAQQAKRGSFMTTCCLSILAWLVEYSLVHWYQQCITVHHVPKFMSCQKAITVVSGRASLKFSNLNKFKMQSKNLKKSMYKLLNHQIQN